VAADIAAAFNAPIAAVTFTIEEIVGGLDNTVLSGVVVAAAIAAMIERSVLGVHPVIAVHQSYGLEQPSSLLTYMLLGIAAAAASILFTESLLRLRLWFRRLRVIPSWTHPAIGGLVTGSLAVWVMSDLHVTGVTGGGYETLMLALAGELGLRALIIILCVIKLIATVFSYSSGGAGGIFAPALSGARARADRLPRARHHHRGCARPRAASAPRRRGAACEGARVRTHASVSLGRSCDPDVDRPVGKPPHTPCAAVGCSVLVRGIVAWYRDPTLRSARA
jgi:CIC family chloride channel protein